jgi:uncharacterized membrane protein YkvI
MAQSIKQYFIPGLVIQSVLVGGSYATGREITEFFLTAGPFGGLMAMILTCFVFSACCMVAFELSRQTRAFDYQSFCETFLGRGAILFELGYFATMTITLSVVISASVEITTDIILLPPLPVALFFVMTIAGLLYLKGSIIEKIMSTWAIIFYITYGLMFLMILNVSGTQIIERLTPEPVGFGVIWSSLTYTGYNIAIIPIVIFVARHFTTRKEALVAGALSGPIILIPGFTLLIALTAFYPGILETPIPISAIFNRLNQPILTMIVQIAILGMLIQTGVGLLHGANERIAKSYENKKGRVFPIKFRPVFAIIALTVSTYLAASVGIIDLVAHGFRYSTYYFLLIFVVPLMTIGFVKIRAQK